MIGHQLTTQGAGIQDHGPIFYPKGNHVMVYIPMDVVFEMLPNADLFAYFPINHYLSQAKKSGWHMDQTVNMQKNLTGFLGKNGWARLPIGVPMNLVQADGNDIFEIQGIVSQAQLLKQHPELKAGIGAASMPAR